MTWFHLGCWRPFCAHTGMAGSLLAVYSGEPTHVRTSAASVVRPPTPLNTAPPAHLSQILLVLTFVSHALIHLGTDWKTSSSSISLHRVFAKTLSSSRLFAPLAYTVHTTCGDTTQVCHLPP